MQAPPGLTHVVPPLLEPLPPPLELPELLPEPQGLAHELVQQLAIAVSSDCTLDDAPVTQSFSQVLLPAQAEMQLIADAHAESFAHVCVTLQQLDCTQLAHVAVFRSTPHATVDPEELPPLLEPLLAHPPLLEPLLLPPNPSVSQLLLEELQPKVPT